MTSSGFISGAANLRTTVANIAERDALIASLTMGDLVPVADTGSGSPGIYQFDGTGFIDLSTVDSTLNASSTNPVENQAVFNALALKADTSSLATVATSGDYTDLTNRPANEATVALITEAGSGAIITTAERSKLGGIEAGAEINVQSDWNETNATADSFIQNKPNLDGLSVSTIGGQPVMTIVDATRGNKVLSVAEHTITWDTNEIDDDKWVRTGLSNVDEASIVLPLNATAVFASAYCVDADAKSKDVVAFVDTTSQGSIGTLAGIGPQNFTNTTLNIDINAGQRFRLKGNLTGGKIRQTIINLIFKWRA